MPLWNSQLPRRRPNPSAGERRSSGDRTEESKNKKEKNKRPRADDAEEGVQGDGVLAPSAAVLDGRGGGLTEDKAARTYQGWLEARYVDYLRALLGWVSEVDDFQRQVCLCMTAQSNPAIPVILCYSPRSSKGGSWILVTKTSDQMQRRGHTLHAFSALNFPLCFLSNIIL